MFESVITNLFATTLYITSSAFVADSLAPQVVFAQTLPQQGYVSHELKQNDSLTNLSTRYYGSEDFWTNIWNDNTWIIDPENIEKDKLVKISITKPVVVEELLPELAGRSAELSEQKNEEYLKSIGYITKTQVEANGVQSNEETAIPTVVPTVAPVVTQPAAPVAPANVPGTISEEAVTYLGQCEAGNDPTKNTGNGYYGAFQFSYGTWKSLNTGYERADLAPIEVQRAAVKQLLSRSSVYNQFPGCAAKMRGAGLI